MHYHGGPELRLGDRQMGAMSVGQVAAMGLALAFFLGSVSPQTSASEPQLAQGVGGAPGSVTSQVLAKIPEGFPIEVVLFDDSDTNIELRELLIKGLEKNGHVVETGSPLELAFETEVMKPSFTEQKPSLGRIQAGNESEVGNRGSRRGVEAEVNLWSTTKDSLLGGRQKRLAQSKHPLFHINAILRDRESGRVIWQGDALCEMLTSNRTRLLRSMAGPLAAAVGKTVVDEPFELR